MHEEESKKIREYILANTNIFDEDVELQDDDNIFKKGFVSSLFAMKLLAFVEKEFTITINDEDIVLTNFNSVNHIMNFILKKRGKQV